MYLMEPWEGTFSIFTRLIPVYFTILRLDFGKALINDNLFFSLKVFSWLHWVQPRLIYRLLELKNEMVNLEFSEYHFFDDVLSDMKLTPADIEIPVPRYFTQVKFTND